MSYLVLARKHRPTSFADIIGQPHVVRTLTNAITTGRVHHAFLFTGARGVGKTTTARVLARALNCAQGPTPSPCGGCTSCTEIGLGNSPDVLEIDGASNTGVDNVRELRENVRYLPSRSRFKLYIIDEVHMLSTAAFNALLKTLEEPPAHVKFVFATTEPQKIPITILSRCQRFDFRKVPVAGLTEHVRTILAKENVALSDNTVATIVREAQGSVRDALSLLDQVLSLGDSAAAHILEALGVVDHTAVSALCQAIIARDTATLLQRIDDLDARGHDLRDVAALVAQHFRDLMVVKVTDNAGALNDRAPGEIETLRSQAEQVSRPDLHRLFQLAVAAAEDVGRSSYQRVTLEMGLLRLLEVEPSQSLSAVLSRLEGLAAGHNRAPQPAQQPAPAKSAPAASGDTWRALVDRLRGKSPAFASVLEHARVLRCSREGLALAVARKGFYWDTLQDSANQQLLRDAAAAHFHATVPLSIEELAPGESQAASLAEQSVAGRQQRIDAIRASAVSHPAVESAARILGGEVQEVIPLLGDE